MVIRRVSEAYLIYTGSDLFGMLLDLVGDAGRPGSLARPDDAIQGIQVPDLHIRQVST